MFQRLVWGCSGVVLLVFFISCSSGGGGDGGGEGRTRDTAVRVVHAALDTVPVSVLVGVDQFIQTARYAEATNYIPVDDGPIAFSVERLNSPGVVLKNIQATLEKKTEYTLFVFGNTLENTLNISLLTDTTERPELGTAYLAVINGYEGPGSISAQSSDVVLGTVKYGSTSGFQVVASGPQTIAVSDGSGNPLSSITTTIVDRGELTLLVTGSRDVGVVFTTLYNDLD